jgi:hypothetical protein
VRPANLAPALKHETALSFPEFVKLYHQLATVQRASVGVVATISGQHPELGGVLIVQSLDNVTLSSEKPYCPES